jgi:hypothetical protein
MAIPFFFCCLRFKIFGKLRAHEIKIGLQR